MLKAVTCWIAKQSVTEEFMDRIFNWLTRTKASEIYGSNNKKNKENSSHNESIELSRSFIVCPREENVLIYILRQHP